MSPEGLTATLEPSKHSLGRSANSQITVNRFGPCVKIVFNLLRKIFCIAEMADTTTKKAGKKRKLNRDDDKDTENKTLVEETASFASFGLDSRLLKAISNQFEKPTLVQAAAIPLSLNGRDIVARAKTGSGKTLAYVIPIINQILTKSVGHLFCAS